MPAAAQMLLGRLIGNYQILCQLGGGGMGVVYKAFDVELRRTVALKFVAPEGETGAADRESVLREARAASLLDHENIAAIHAVEQTTDGQLCIVMAYYEGETLASRLRRRPFTPTEAVKVVRQIARGLSHAHSHNVVHRDIKPSNVILTRDGVAKIVDFGLARVCSADASTRSLSFAGTLPYMSPEHLSGKSVDARADIWSLGVLLHELLLGRLPFQGESPAGTVAAVLNALPPPMGNVQPELQLVIYRALAKDPENRYQTCVELLRDLEGCDTVGRSSGLVADARDLNHRVRQAVAFTAPRSRVWARGALWLAFALVLMLAAAITPGVRNRIFPQHKSSNAVAPGDNPRAVSPAYESYLKGVRLLSRYDKPENLNEAVQLFEVTIRADPNFALAFAALAEAFWDKYRLEQDARWVEKAEASARQAAGLNAQLPAVYVILGRIHDGRGERDLALQEFQRALDLDPRNVAAFLGQADAFTAAGRIREAEEGYRKAIAMRSEEWEGPYRLAVFYYRQGRYADAAEQFRRVVELVPDHAPAHTNLGVMLLKLRQFAEAEAELKRSLALTPSYSAYTNLGLIYLRQRRFVESAAMTEKALQLNQHDYRVWANLAVAYDWLGEAGKASQAYGQELKELEATAKLKTEDPHVQSELGILYAQRGQRTKAVRRLEAALALAPEDPHILGDVAEGYEALGDRRQALKYVRRSLARGWTIVDFQESPGMRALLADPANRSVFEEAEPDKSEHKANR